MAARPGHRYRTAAHAVWRTRLPPGGTGRRTGTARRRWTDRAARRPGVPMAVCRSTDRRGVVERPADELAWQRAGDPQTSGNAAHRTTNITPRIVREIGRAHV